MKIVIYFFIVFIIISPIETSGQIFSQDFSSSATLDNYYNSSPSTNQFRAITTNGAGATVSISANALVMARVGSTSNIAYADRNVDFSTIPSGMVFQFDLSVSGNSIAGTSSMTVFVGGSVVSGSSAPSVANTYAKFGINISATDGQFQIRDITNSTTGSHTFSGTQTITWILNNTGSSQTYTSPTGSTVTVENDKADIWVGTIKEFDNVSVATSSQTLARFKFLADDLPNDNCSVIIDNIVIYNESALPVELVSFTGAVVNNAVLLNWETATEINNYGFSIERKVSDGNWISIGFVNGHGNSNSPKHYSFTDYTSSQRLINYRLKQIDLNGTYEYSPIVNVNINGPSQLLLKQNYPNPFNPATVINYQLPKDGFVTLKVHDILGKEVASLVSENKQAGYYNVTFNASNLPSGIYIYSLQANSFNQSKKMLLIK